VFLGHNFGSRYARRPIKCSKNANDRLVSNKSLSQKNDSLDWRPGPLKVGQNSKTCPFVTSPREYPTPKSNNFFIETRRLVESVDGLNSFLA